MKGRRIVSNRTCRKVRYQLLPLKLVKRKTVARLAEILITLHVSDYARIHFQLNIACRTLLARFVVLSLKVDTGHAASRNDVCTQAEGGYCNNRSRNHIGLQHPLKAHSRGEHGNDFRVFCQFGGKENHRDKDKQRTEKIGKIGNEIEVVIKDDSTPGCIVLHETVHALIEVKHHCNGDNQCNGKDIGAKEFFDDIVIQFFHNPIS